MIESIDNDENNNQDQNEIISLNEDETINLNEDETINLNEDETSETIYIEINNPDICVICLENLNDDDTIKKACYNCNIKCHKKCLKEWHKSKRQKVCPICLKTINYYRKKKLRELLDENDELNQDTESEVGTDSDVEEIIINNRIRNRYYYINLYRRIFLTKNICTCFIFCVIGMYMYEYSL